jgi:hypothetical protein
MASHELRTKDRVRFAQVCESGTLTLAFAEETPMAANPDPLYEKLKALPPQRRAEVEDFLDFLIRKEARTAALDRLLAIAPALEVAGMQAMSDHEIQAEIDAARAERRNPTAATQPPKDPI